MKSPLVGLNCKLARDKDGDLYYKLDHLYVKAVRRAGGVPVILPFFDTDEAARSYLDRLDGLLLTGGPDLDPRHWGEPVHPRAVLLEPEKEASDLRLARLAVERDLPVLGICLGLQVLNVALRGSLLQHVEGHAEGVSHGVEMLGPSRVAEAVGARPTVNSYHHQVVNRPGRGLRITARSADGLIEGVEHESCRWVAGVQWHPERMAGAAEQERLFGAFLAACVRGG